MSPDINPIEHQWGIFKWRMEECEVSKVSDIHQLCECITKKQNRIPVANWEALENSAPNRVQEGL